MPDPNVYRIEITIPLHGISREKREQLFTALANVVHEWEPEDREGWDAFMGGHAEHDELGGG